MTLLAALPSFLSQQQMSRNACQKFALRAVAGIAVWVLLGFLVGGQYLLETFGLRWGSFTVAGWDYLFSLFAAEHEFSGDTETHAGNSKAAERDHLAGAVFRWPCPLSHHRVQCWRSSF